MTVNTRLLIRTLIGIALLGATASSPVQAQPTAWIPDAVACADTTPGVATYARCALLLDRPGVRRGVEATVVARPGIFSPFALSRLVVGDSAKMYAARYERSARTAQFFGLLGAALVAAGVVYADAHHASADCITGYPCKDTVDETVPLGLVIAGTGAFVISVPLQLQAQRAAARAVWWNNARFAR